MQPLQIEHAGEMAKVLSDPDLYTFTGGEPPSVDVLAARYRRQLAGPGRTDEQWFNWVIRHDDELVGYVQTTVTGSTAEIAWVIGTGWQGHGYAKEAAQGLVNWLRARGIQRIIAHVHPDHAASAAVTAAAGLTRTDRLDDGEYLWTT
jgi:RimJ/RimL family protein N-acetyltransferase